LLNGGRDVQVSVKAAQAETLLNTKFHLLTNKKTSQQVTRAATYTVPTAVQEVLRAVFGLHGLPLPPRTPLQSRHGLGAEPAKVTPAVIASTYSVSGVKPTGSDKNTMAVAEFQGQYEKDTDLAKFFKEFVPSAAAGDEKVSKFVGTPDKQEAGVEASLDIQYIMGVAPHIKTEFWLFAGQDFCQDLKNWTSVMLADTSLPAVHSISYGWQGDLEQVQCTDDKVSVIDDNYMKLAAQGITIIFASGDSGSGYTPTEPVCYGSHSNNTNNTVLSGEILSSAPSNEFSECCDEAEGSAWSWTPPRATPWPTCRKGSTYPEGKTYEGTMIYDLKTPTVTACCGYAQEAHWYFHYIPSTSSCQIFYQITGTKDTPGALYGQPEAELEGVCAYYQTVTGSKPLEGAMSGGTNSKMPILWPSWPASSPYITAVGATRFVGQQPGNPEMATDQFGSGGGFSKQFGQSPNAKWQIEAVQAYVNNPPKDPHYPPPGSFPPKGRATPDVSALGEGYQVVTDGDVQSVGGTSASAPAFAGLVALLNEARLQKGMKAMGFLNPFLYANPDAFTDVTLGTNAVGRGSGPIKYGFNATKGWDPATGLGTPIFTKLLAAALNATKA